MLPQFHGITIPGTLVRECDVSYTYNTTCFKLCDLTTTICVPLPRT